MHACVELTVLFADTNVPFFLPLDLAGVDFPFVRFPSPPPSFFLSFFFLLLIGP